MGLSPTSQPSSFATYCNLTVESISTCQSCVQYGCRYCNGGYYDNKCLNISSTCIGGTSIYDSTDSCQKNSPTSLVVYLILILVLLFGGFFLGFVVWVVLYICRKSSKVFVTNYSDPREAIVTLGMNNVEISPNAYAAAEVIEIFDDVENRPVLTSALPVGPASRATPVVTAVTVTA